ncbi:MAG: hypothetical protein SPLM_05570, partial [Spiroplasma phoeniceum]
MSKKKKTKNDKNIWTKIKNKNKIKFDFVFGIFILIQIT